MPKYDPAMLIAIEKEVVDCKLGSGSALLNLKSNIYYGLNEVGSFVWNEMAEPVTFGQLCRRTEAEFGADFEEVNKDLSSLVGHMDDAGLVRCFRE